MGSTYASYMNRLKIRWFIKRNILKYLKENVERKYVLISQTVKLE